MKVEQEVYGAKGKAPEGCAMRYVPNPGRKDSKED